MCTSTYTYTVITTNLVHEGALLCTCTCKTVLYILVELTIGRPYRHRSLLQVVSRTTERSKDERSYNGRGTPSCAALLCAPCLRAHGQQQRGLAEANGGRRTTGATLALEADCGKRGTNCNILGADVQAAPRYSD